MSVNIEALFQHLMEDPDIIPPDGEDKEDIAMAMATQRAKQSKNNVKALNMAKEDRTISKLLAFLKAEDDEADPRLFSQHLKTFDEFRSRMVTAARKGEEYKWPQRAEGKGLTAKARKNKQAWEDALEYLREFAPKLIDTYEQDAGFVGGQVAEDFDEDAPAEAPEDKQPTRAQRAATIPVEFDAMREAREARSQMSPEEREAAREARIKAGEGKETAEEAAKESHHSLTSAVDAQLDAKPDVELDHYGNDPDSPFHQSRFGSLKAGNTGANAYHNIHEQYSKEDLEEAFDWHVRPENQGGAGKSPHSINFGGNKDGSIVESEVHTMMDGFFESQGRQEAPSYVVPGQRTLPPAMFPVKDTAASDWYMDNIPDKGANATAWDQYVQDNFPNFQDADEHVLNDHLHAFLNSRRKEGDAEIPHPPKPTSTAQHVEPDAQKQIIIAGQSDDPKHEIEVRLSEHNRAVIDNPVLTPRQQKLMIDSANELGQIVADKVSTEDNQIIITPPTDIETSEAILDNAAQIHIEAEANGESSDEQAQAAKKVHDAVLIHEAAGGDAEPVLKNKEVRYKKLPNGQYHFQGGAKVWGDLSQRDAIGQAPEGEAEASAETPKERDERQGAFDFDAPAKSAVEQLSERQRAAAEAPPITIRPPEEDDVDWDNLNEAERNSVTDNGGIETDDGFIDAPDHIRERHGYAPADADAEPEAPDVEITPEADEPKAQKPMTAAARKHLVDNGIDPDDPDSTFAEQLAQIRTKKEAEALVAEAQLEEVKPTEEEEEAPPAEPEPKPEEREAEPADAAPPEAGDPDAQPVDEPAAEPGQTNGERIDELTANFENLSQHDRASLFELLNHIEGSEGDVQKLSDSDNEFLNDEHDPTPLHEDVVERFWSAEDQEKYNQEPPSGGATDDGIDADRLPPQHESAWQGKWELLDGSDVIQPQRPETGEPTREPTRPTPSGVQGRLPGFGDGEGETPPEPDKPAPTKRPRRGQQRLDIPKPTAAERRAAQPSRSEAQAKLDDAGVEGEPGDGPTPTRSRSYPRGQDPGERGELGLIDNQGKRDFLLANKMSPEHLSSLSNEELDKAFRTTHKKISDKQMSDHLNGKPDKEEILKAMAKAHGRDGDDEYLNDLREEYQFASPEELVKEHKAIEKEKAANKFEHARSQANADALSMEKLPEEGTDKLHAMDRARDIAKKMNDSTRAVRKGGKPLLDQNSRAHLKDLLDDAVNRGQMSQEEIDGIADDANSMQEDFLNDEHQASINDDNTRQRLHHEEFLDHAEGTSEESLKRKGHDLDHSKAHELHHYETNEDGTVGKRTGSSHHVREEDGSVGHKDGADDPDSVHSAVEGMEAGHPPKLLGLSDQEKLEQNEHFKLMKKAAAGELEPGDFEQFKEYEANNPNLAAPSYKGQVLGAIRHQLSGEDGAEKMSAMGIDAKDHDEAAESSCRPPQGAMPTGPNKAWNPDSHRWCDKEYLDELKGQLGPGEASYHPNGLHADSANPEHAGLDQDAQGNTQAVMVTPTGVHKVNPSSGGMKTADGGHVNHADILGHHLQGHEGGKVDKDTLHLMGMNHSEKHTGDGQKGGTGGKGGSGLKPVLGKLGRMLQGNKKREQGRPNATGQDRQRARRDTEGSPSRSFLNRLGKFTGDVLRDAAEELPAYAGGNLIRGGQELPFGLETGGGRTKVGGTDRWQDKQIRQAADRVKKRQIAAAKLTERINRVMGENE